MNKVRGAFIYVYNRLQSLVINKYWITPHAIYPGRNFGWEYDKIVNVG